MTTEIKGLPGRQELGGQHLGYSDWMEITQERIDQFADATGDHQWIHVDPERAKDGPFGTTIAHGYLTLSLGPALAPSVFRTSGFSMGVNYGCGKVRFPSPVPVGSKLRLGVEVKSVDVTGEGQCQATYLYTFEVEGASKPSCVAEVIVRMYE
jgi:acyl dehydratase